MQGRNPGIRDRHLTYQSDPEILTGTPVFTGTRGPADALPTYLRKGKRIADFLEDFPTVTQEQVEGLRLVEADVLATP